MLIISYAWLSNSWCCELTLGRNFKFDSRHMQNFCASPSIDMERITSIDSRRVTSIDMERITSIDV